MRNETGGGRVDSNLVYHRGLQCQCGGSGRSRTDRGQRALLCCSTDEKLLSLNTAAADKARGNVKVRTGVVKTAPVVSPVHANKRRMVPILFYSQNLIWEGK